MRSPIGWSGTFHAVGARLLRMYATSVGLEPAFTIHDREDSADLMNLVRHELGLSEKAQRFPLKATCLAIYSRAVNAGEPLEVAARQAVSLVRGVEGRAARSVCGLRRGQAEAACARLRRPAALLGRADAGAGAGGRRRCAVRPRAGRRVPGHQRAAGLDPARAQAGRRRADRSRRRRAGHLWLPRRNRAQHPRLSEPVPAPGRDRAAGAELPLDPADPRRLQCRHRAGPRAVQQEPALAPRFAASRPALVSVQDDIGQVDLVVETVLENREAGMALKEQAVLFRTSHHSAMLEIELTRRNIPFVKFGGLKFIEAAHVKDMLARAALGGEPGRPRDRLSRRATAAGARSRPPRPRSSMPWPGDRPSTRWPRSARPPRRPSIGASWSC